MSEGLPHLLFYIFSALAVVFAVLVITMNNPVRSAIALVFVFFSAAGLWLLTETEFLALILVLVYVGAVMTLFLFIVMMINVEVQSMAKHFVYYAPLGVFLVALIVGLVIKMLPEHLIHVKAIAADASITNTMALGNILYTDYVLAFELAAVILLVAIIAAISLAHRQKSRSKKQCIVKQNMTTKEERLRILTMAPVKRMK